MTDTFGYPDANYAAAPEYPSDTGASCATPKPTSYWDSGNFCNDVFIGGNLTVLQNVDISTLTVEGTPYVPTLFMNPFDGLFYNVLASAVSSPTPN